MVVTDLLATLHKRRDARTMSLTIDQDSTGTALPFAATIFAACEVELLAKDGKEAGVRLRVDNECVPVDQEADLGGHVVTSNRKRVRRCGRMRNRSDSAVAIEEMSAFTI